jgi:caa(3)-type oxidase subunit IV
VAGHTHSQSTELHDNELHEHVVPPTTQSLFIFAVLCGLALVALIIGFNNELGTFKVVASLACTVIQVSVVAYFFMELRQSDTLTWLCVVTAIFFTGLQFLFTLTDYLTRHLGVL